MKTFLETVDGLAPGQRAAIRRALDPTTVSFIDHAPPTEWAPVEHNLALTRAAARELSAEELASFYRVLVAREFASSMFKSFIAMVGRLLGVSPHAYVKYAPEGWKLVFRDCGRFAALPGEGSRARLRYEAIPPVFCGDDCWLESVRLSFYSCFDLCEVDGTVTWGELDLAAGRAEFVFCWSPQKGPRAPHVSAPCERS